MSGALDCYKAGKGVYVVPRAEESAEYVLARMHASLQGRCEYSGYWLGWEPGKRRGGVGQEHVEQEVEVDHRVEIHIFEVLMEGASKALTGWAEGYHLPWSAQAQAWVARFANSLTNLCAVNLDAHARKTALGKGFKEALVRALRDDTVAMPYVEAHYAARLRAQRGGKCGKGALVPSFPAALAHTFVMLSLEMLRGLPSVSDAGEHGPLLCEWLARALGALGGLRGDPNALAPRHLAFEGESQEQGEAGPHGEE